MIAVPHVEIQRRIEARRKSRPKSIVAEMDAEFRPLPESPARKTTAKKQGATWLPEQVERLRGRRLRKFSMPFVWMVPFT